MDNTIDAREFCDTLARRGLDFFCGVPDSLLADLCACVADDATPFENLICANEGNAVGVACGWYVGTGRPAVVYMQNSGEGNAVNPLLSLADPDVYGIPMMLVIGWRGEPGIPDEPQHAKQGKVTLALLEAMGVPFKVLNPALWESQIAELSTTMAQSSRPVAIVVRKGTFASYPHAPEALPLPLTRETALETILSEMGTSDLVVSTTGKESREVFEVRERRHEPHDRDFLTVGGMGHTLSIALGLARGCNRKVWCLDGDGSMLMHLGGLAVAAQCWPDNLRYIVNVNGAHESVGGQPNVAGRIDVPAVLCGLGLGRVLEASDRDQLASGMRDLACGSARALVVYTRQGSRGNLGRPTVAPAANMAAMMRLLDSTPSEGGLQ